MASAAFSQSSLLRPRPFELQRFLAEQARSLTTTMSASEGEKLRTSAEVSRNEATLPTVNPAVEKQEPPKATLHPAFYVM